MLRTSPSLLVAEPCPIVGAKGAPSPPNLVLLQSVELETDAGADS